MADSINLLIRFPALKRISESYLCSINMPVLVLICISFFLHCSIFKVHPPPRDSLHIIPQEILHVKNFFQILEKYFSEPICKNALTVKINIHRAARFVNSFFSFVFIFLLFIFLRLNRYKEALPCARSAHWTFPCRSGTVWPALLSNPDR